MDRHCSSVYILIVRRFTSSFYPTCAIGTPPDVIAKFNAAVVDTLIDPKSRSRFAELAQQLSRANSRQEALGANHREILAKLGSSLAMTYSSACSSLRVHLQLVTLVSTFFLHQFRCGHRGATCGRQERFGWLCARQGRNVRGGVLPAALAPAQSRSSYRLRTEERTQASRRAGTSTNANK